MSAGARRPRPRTTRRPGRPAGGDAAVREALLATARRLFLAHGFGPVTIRRIASEAGSSPATIHYHFGDKLGLYRAMLEAAIGPVAATLERLDDPERVRDVDIASFMRLYARMLADNPWVPALIVQEVLAEGGRFRAQFIERFAGRLVPLFVELVRREQRRGALRADLDPRLAALSAISLTVFPFLALPVTSRVLGVSASGPALEQMVEHTTRLFREGAEARPGRQGESEA